LKFYESVAEFVLQLLGQEMSEARVELDLRRLYRILDYTEYGGAQLLGVNGVVIICHGGSPPKAVTNAVRVAVHAVEQDIVTHIRNRLGALQRARG
jgi:glycerol-3-phosphate acyltransferase PlsX